MSCVTLLSEFLPNSKSVVFYVFAIVATILVVVASNFIRIKLVYFSLCMRFPHVQSSCIFSCLNAVYSEILHKSVIFSLLYYSDLFHLESFAPILACL